MSETDIVTLPTQNIGQKENLPRSPTSTETTIDTERPLGTGEKETEKPTTLPVERAVTGVIHRESSDAFREAIETDASVSMNLLNQSAESMLSLVQDKGSRPEERVAAANALASSMQTQVNMVKALTSVMKISKRK